MADIAINGKSVKGNLSITRTLDNSSEEPRIIIGGTLSTHRYFEEITTIQTARYALDGVDVYQELFGSDDFNIVYNFTAESLEVKGGESNLKEAQIVGIERKLYGGENNE